jgi:hypothetical protein
LARALKAIDCLSLFFVGRDKRRQKLLHFSRDPVRPHQHLIDKGGQEFALFRKLTTDGEISGDFIGCRRAYDGCGPLLLRMLAVDLVPLALNLFKACALVVGLLRW